MDKKDEETHAMDKPKPLEVVSDGDLSEVKKDPVWKTWLEKETGYIDSKGKKHKPNKKQSHQVHTRKRERDRKTEMWRDLTEGGAIIQKINNITKPIPDSKGGRGSFQHCINANQDKNNPGGWCKQIERKISKAKKKKEVKLPQTKIDEPKHWWDHSKVGRQGDIDQKTGRPWWEVATEEKERRKREAKEKTDYFVEEIRSNIIYHNKILPIIGMVAGQAARGMGKGAKKLGGELLEGASEVGQGMLQGVAEEEEE